MRRALWTIALIVALYLLVPMFLGETGMVQYFRMRQTYHRLDQEVAELDRHNDELGDEVRAMRSDPLTIERVARERLGLVRPGEMVYQFEPPRP